MDKTKLYPRYIEPHLIEALSDFPVVLIHGPRQCGKTTLAQQIGERLRYTYISLDDDVTRTIAENDPIGFVAELPERTIIDEVQRVPTLASAIKLAIDRNRTPGRFILTGSANVLLLPKLSDSLAGRMRIIRLHPLSQNEITRSQSQFIDTLFTTQFGLQQIERLDNRRLAQIISAGGYPPALSIPEGTRRTNWYRDYLTAQVQRDVRDMARIGSLDVLPRMLAISASQTARLFNLAQLSAPFQLSRTTIKDYSAILEQLFMIERLPPWHTNRIKRLVKTPKLHIADTGLATALLNTDLTTFSDDRSLFGQLLETFIYQELRKQASWNDMHIDFFHYRDRHGAEVDIVIDGGHRGIVGIEVKASATVTPSDFRGLRKLQNAIDERFTAGIVLYNGETAIRFGGKLQAVPVRLLWDT